ncbi:MAG: glycosyltransferase, partial [Prevotellaceae bacterium]|nr:glycosyltransferase [Prevotellaceae bacterium]
MKYAIVQAILPIAHGGGVKMQCIMWADGLRKLGHQVDLINPWDDNDWKSYDAIIVVGYALGIRLKTEGLAKNNPNMVMAPIIDPHWPDWVYKFFCKYWGNHKRLGLTSRFHDLWLSRKYFKLWLVRSEEERHYTSYCLERPQEMIKKVPLHYRIPDIDAFPEKENFCLHASRLADRQKNVARLIEAAKRYGFPLKLAGHLHGEREAQWLHGLIDGARNIEYVGEVSDEELRNLYKRAKALALPSLHEGVGMVALEAAAYGCEIVLTNVGAPKEYYDGRAILVNPASVDEIGESVMKALNEGHAQPELMSYVKSHYSERACCELLNKCIVEAISK